MSAVLGVSAFYHDAAAALVVDGRIVAAAQEERFSRVKHDASFPARAVAYCLAEAGLAPGDLDAVAFHEKPLLKFERLLETHLASAPRSLPAFLRAMPSWLRRKLHVERTLRRALPGFAKRFVFAEHHLSHAASAFLPSPFDEAAVVTLDGVGEWATATVGRGQERGVTLLEELCFPHSLGLLYSAFTVLCGFEVNDGEYKLMGLAPYGEPRFADLILERLIDLKSDGSFRLHPRWFGYAQGLSMTTPRLHRLLGRKPRAAAEPLTQVDMDLAASIQRVTEEVMLRAARHAHALTKSRHLCLAGGVSLNCVGNGRVVREGPFEEVWIQPAAGDAGGALGAALWTAHTLLGHPRAPGADAMGGARLGPRFTSEEARGALDAAGVVYECIPDETARVERTAALLAEGKVVGWFQGRMEFGPRALGSRSILADPRDPSMQSRVNQMVKFRESFRPFAPAVLAEEAQAWFDLARARESPYMLVVAPVAAGRRLEPDALERARTGLDRLRTRRSTVPAVTHVDGSARVQTVDAARDPLFHRLLEAFERRTGCPVLVNTSFNVKDEPIVLSPADALACFERTAIDALVIEDLLVLADAKRAVPGAAGPWPHRGGAEGDASDGRGRTRDAVEGAPATEPEPGMAEHVQRWVALGPAFLLSALAGLLLWRGVPLPFPLALAGAGVLASVLLLALPPLRLPFLRGWMAVALPVGRLVTAALLALVYLLVLTPIGLLLRLFGRDPLERRPDPAASTYWRPHAPRTDPEDPFRPY